MMTVGKQLLISFGVMFLSFIVTSAEMAVAAKGGGGTTTEVMKNIQVVDGTNKLVGDVVGTNQDLAGFNPRTPRILEVIVDPALVNQDSSLLIFVTGDSLYGSDVNLYFDGFNCTGNAYFESD